MLREVKLNFKHQKKLKTHTIGTAYFTLLNFSITLKGLITIHQIGSTLSLVPDAKWKTLIMV